MSKVGGVVRWFAVGILLTATAAMAAGPEFAPQSRLGYSTGDQWEPSIAADGSGHVYMLFPQYGTVPGCSVCAVPTVALTVSEDNGHHWSQPRPLAPAATGQFDPQIVVDSADRQTVYASWLQSNKREVMVARSGDFGRTWTITVADHAETDSDRPVLAVRGQDVYVGFNHEERVFAAASHDGGQSFRVTAINPRTEAGFSLASGATVDPAGNVFFGWTSYAPRALDASPVKIYVGRSMDGGVTWATGLLDVSGAPPGCWREKCEPGYLGAQIVLASDGAGRLYAAWNAGAGNGEPERIYFVSSASAGAGWSAKQDISTARDGVEHCFPALVAGVAGDVRVAWMDQRSGGLWNTYYRASSNSGVNWSAAVRLSGGARGYDYVRPEGFRFPFGDYFSLAIDDQKATHAVWGEGRNYKSPGSLWYTRSN